MTDAVGGTVDGGKLTMTQTAAGGAGGASSGGVAGIGGAATSSLTFKNLQNGNVRSYADTVNAFGGAGGEGLDGSAGANSGAATAASNLTGRYANSTANSMGGAGGAGISDADGGRGGKATASSVADDSFIPANKVNSGYSTASATGGAGGAADGAGYTGGTRRFCGRDRRRYGCGIGTRLCDRVTNRRSRRRRE